MSAARHQTDTYARSPPGKSWQSDRPPWPGVEIAGRDITPALCDIAKRHRQNLLSTYVAIFVVPSLWFDAESCCVESATFVENEHAMTPSHRILAGRMSLHSRFHGRRTAQPVGDKSNQCLALRNAARHPSQRRKQSHLIFGHKTCEQSFSLTSDSIPGTFPRNAQTLRYIFRLHYHSTTKLPSG